jgi:hypothetical protein
MAPPAADADRPESPTEHEFRFGVLGFDSSHYPAALFSAEDVRHLFAPHPTPVHHRSSLALVRLWGGPSGGPLDPSLPAGRDILCLTDFVSAPPFARALLGWRRPSRSGVSTPNTSDAASRQSVAIASHILTLLGLTEQDVAADNPATPFEEGVRTYLEASLTADQSGRDWVVNRDRRVTEFSQYSHLARVQEIIDQDVTRTLAAELGRDYVIKPDVTVGIQARDSLMLHASVSCKWTIRSDRVQNIRHEAVILTRHRRGRQPHIMAVTAEPLPTRIASIARGTGEIDAVYHVAFEELTEAVQTVGTVEQKATLSELSGQGRLYDFNVIPDVLQF